VYLGATLLGNEARALVDAPGPTTMSDSDHWTLHDVAVFDDDVRLTYEPARS